MLQKEIDKDYTIEKFTKAQKEKPKALESARDAALRFGVKHELTMTEAYRKVAHSESIKLVEEYHRVLRRLAHERGTYDIMTPE